MSATMARQLICPPRLLFHLSSSPFLALSGSLAVSSVRTGPHYSLLSLLALRLQCAVLHSPVPLSCHAVGSSLISLVHKAPVDVCRYPLEARCFQSSPSHVGEGRTLCQLAPTIRTERYYVLQSCCACERLGQMAVLNMQQLMVLFFILLSFKKCSLSVREVKYKLIIIMK